MVMEEKSVDKNEEKKFGGGDEIVAVVFSPTVAVVVPRQIEFDKRGDA